MPADPTVSVILPTFNRARFIAAALDSVLSQSLPASEIIVIDDGSTDGTVDVVARFGAAVRYHRQPNGGKLAAISAGLDRVTGDLVWIMDDDDIAPPDAIRALAAPFAADPALVMSYGRMTRFSAETETSVPYPDDDRPFLPRLMEDCFITGHPCVMVRRAALDRIRPFDPSLIASVDYYLHLHVALQGRVAAVDAVVLHQRQHDGPRGPARAQYGESARVAKWMAHDARILGDLLHRLPLAAYLDGGPVRDRPLSEADRRRALIQRAVIAGRKRLWPRALADLDAAMGIAPDRPLSEDELAILSGLLGSRYGIDEVLEAPDTLPALRDAVSPRPDSAVALAALSRPLLQSLRAGRHRGRTLRGWFRLMDMRATGHAVGGSLGRNLARAAARLRP